jgi:hypothetical protein
MTVYTARITFNPKYYDRPRHCFVPAWTAEIVDGLPRGRTVYSDGCPTRDAAISNLVAQLLARGLHGKLRLEPAKETV